MREILFRGKPKNQNEFYHFSNVWRDCIKDGFVIGPLIVAADRYYICVSTIGVNKSAINNGIVSMIEVIPETVGQYTGLTDKNGKKIFEGDIVHLYAGEHSISRYKEIDYNALVIFKDGGFCAIDGTEDDYALRRYNFVSRNLYCEVISNIHDNPGLLKEANNE